jgi:FtsH-binding integral membrane protein
MEQCVANYQYGSVVANAAVNERTEFIRKTYVHLTGSVVAFTLLSTFLYTSGFSQSICTLLLGNGRIGWFLVLLAFMGVTHVANQMASSETII